MMSHSLFIQLGMIGVAVAIFYLYVSPTMDVIRANEDATAEYRKEIEKVTGVNSDLTSYLASVQATPVDDRQAVERYLPTTIDDVSLMRELVTILGQQGLTPTTLSYGGFSAAVESPSLAAPFVLIPHTFSMSVEVSYDGLKRLLAALEVNDYLLEVSSLTVSPTDTDSVTADFTLTRYALGRSDIKEEPTAAQ